MSSESQPTGVVEVFYSYSHKDEELRDQLENHLATLKREGVIKGWHDRAIDAGGKWREEIDDHLDTAHIILLLISADFIASDYCYSIEMGRAMQRHEAGEARVIPIILRPCDWESPPLDELQALPKNALAVISWPNRDEAFRDIAKGIRKVVEKLRTGRLHAPRLPSIPRPPIIGFVARRDEQGRDIVERLKEELAPQGSQLVTLSGPGGVGKTTLAAETARALKDVFKGRIVWSSAEGRADFTLSTLLDEISTQLGRADLRPLAPDAKAAQVHALVAESPTLIVLDNYETIADEAKKNIEEWFSRAQCPALITSRHRINSTLYVKVAAMSPEEAQEFLGKVIGQTQDAQIFSDKVRQRIYETAEANPFVMQWIVAQIDEAKEPDMVLEELQHGEGDAAQRVFDRSFNLPQLGDDGRAALLALSLFAPSATRDALTEVAGFDDVKRTNEAVKNLRALWLIKAIDENRRFTIEGLTRSLARARLSKDSRAAKFRQRFVAHFMNHSAAHSQLTAKDFDELETEKNNLLGAMDVAYEMKVWQSVMMIRDTLEGFLSLRGYWDDAIQRGEQAVQAARHASSALGVALFAHNVARIHHHRGDLIEARRLYDESLGIKKRLGNQSGIASTLHNLAVLAHAQGELEEARRLCDESLEIRKNLGDQSGIADTLHNLAVLAQARGELAEARRLYDESLEIHKKISDQSGIAFALYELGRLAQNQGELAEARRLYDESLEIRKNLGDQSGIANTLHALANLAFSQGELTEARLLYDDSLAITEKLGDKSNRALIFYNLGLLTEKEGNKTEAVRLWRESLSILEILRSPYAEIVRRELERVEGEDS